MRLAGSKSLGYDSLAFSARRWSLFLEIQSYTERDVPRLIREYADIVIDNDGMIEEPREKILAIEF